MNEHDDIGPSRGGPATERRTVLLAVFDILGFSKRVENCPLDEVRKTYDLLRQKTVERFELDSFDLLRMDDVLVPAILRLDVESVVFSDSVFAWVPLKKGFANPFITWCCHFICEGLAMDLPIRGAIAAGDAILDQGTDTYLGRPIIEAHDLEADQEWIGLAFTHQATWPPLIADISPRLLMEYAIPVKKGAPAPLSPDWPRVWRQRYGTCSSSHLKLLAEKQPVDKRKYYLNAAAYAEHSQIHTNWFEGDQPEGAFLRMRPYEDVIEETREAERRKTKG